MRYTLRLRGSVIPSVLPDVMIITGFSATIMFFETSEIFGITLNIASVIVPALSVVVGLILAFRTNTAYDRYWEGRKLWASLDVQIRNFSRMVWIGMKEAPQVSTPASSATSESSGSKRRSMIVHAHQLFGRSDSSTKTISTSTSKTTTTRSYRNTNSTNGSNRTENASSATLIEIDSPQHGIEQDNEENHERLLVIRLLLAFAVSVKHHLRQEFGTRYFDLEGLLPEGFEPCAANENIEIKVAHDKALGDRHRHFNEDTWTIQADNEDGQMSLPLEVAHGLMLMIMAKARAGQIETSLIGNLLGSVNTMVDIFTNMERIVFTPIPLAYSIHLRQVVYLYCLALPFTFIEILGWGLVPLMCLVSFTLFGVEAIGREIENPFGKDENDLHMDDFCRDLKRELNYTVNLMNVIPGAHE
ncbi:hypothetical protein BGZ50_004394 [Haplosporangium sp. Z 11]|nr:hypothetical protein BGZ50_004394 [Haplosporangium sp. Z 11]